jgi:hypothetical protein
MHELCKEQEEEEAGREGGCFALDICKGSTKLA